jgi:DNA modification methylase
MGKRGPKPKDLEALRADALTRFPVEPGQVWELRSKRIPGLVHRIMCGSSHVEAHVKILLQGRPVDLMIADGPYCSGGFQEVRRALGTIAGGAIFADNLSTWGYTQLFLLTLINARPRAVYVFSDWRMGPTTYGLIEACGLPVRSKIVWDKGTPALGALWRNQYEEIYFAAVDGSAPRKGKAGSANVLRWFAPLALKFRRELGAMVKAARTGNRRHETEKPVGLIKELLWGDEVSPRGACMVYVPFAGSGTDVEACEAHGRPCYAMEVLPGNVAVLLDRMTELGLEAELVGC